MDTPTLIVPGLHGSGPDHWQSWLEQQLPHCQRVTGIDWTRPRLADWADTVREALKHSPQPLRIIAHNFGCLATAVAAADRPQNVAQLILVAPADPERFDFIGQKQSPGHPDSEYHLGMALPTAALPQPSLLLASRNDAWLDYRKAERLAAIWDCELIDTGDAGHLNPEAGYGPWPALLDLLATHPPAPQYVLDARQRSPKGGRGSTLARVRRFTRQQLDSSPARLAIPRP